MMQKQSEEITESFKNNEENIKDECFQEAMSQCELETIKLQEINDKMRQELREKQTELSKLKYELLDL